MSDNFGALSFPVQPVPVGGSVSDPALDKIGAYLAACLNQELNKSWGQVNPGRKFVESIQTNQPDDTFNEKNLPALFLWRFQTTNDQVSDDWTEVLTDVQLTWVPQNAVQAKRAMRSPGMNGFQKVVTRALALGRSPAWVDLGDPDPTAPMLGSVLIERCRLFRWPYITTVKTDPIQIIKGSEVASYTAFTAMLRISEITQWDESFDSILGTDRAPSALDNTVSQGPGFSLETLIPKP